MLPAGTAAQCASREILKNSHFLSPSQRKSPGTSCFSLFPGDPVSSNYSPKESGSASATQWHTEGTGGRPNFELIVDYGPVLSRDSKEPELWFQLHTMIKLRTPDDFGHLGSHLANDHRDDAINTIKNGYLEVDPQRLEALLRAAFAINDK